MAVSITREDLRATDLRQAAGRSRDAAAARRMLAIALVLEGARRGDAARHCGMDRQTLRDWVHRYNSEGLAGLCDRAHGGGARPRLSAEQQAEVAAWVRAGPDFAKDGVVRWRLVDLQGKIAVAFDVHLHERSVGKIVRRLGFRRISVRPRHPQADAAAQDAHKKNFAALVRDALPPAARGKPIELWWQDEARIGQQGSLTYIWAERGSRPRAPRDQRYDWVYLFGAVCPARGTGVGLVLPEANVDAMNLHLAEIGRNIAPDAHAIVVLDGAGWHQTGGRLCVPDNLSLLHLPPYSPELNPAENVWQCLRQNYLSNRVFDTYDTIVDACCDAWNALMAKPDRIRSIAQRNWANPVTT